MMMVMIMSVCCEQAWISIGIKVFRSLDFLNRCIRPYVFAINQLQRKALRLYLVE